MTAVAPSSKQALLTVQRNWITHTRNICQDAACMEEAYIKQIDVLARNEKYIVDRSSCEIPDGASRRSVVVLRDPNCRLQSFHRSNVRPKDRPGDYRLRKADRFAGGNGGWQPQLRWRVRARKPLEEDRCQNLQRFDARAFLD